MARRRSREFQDAGPVTIDPALTDIIAAIRWPSATGKASAATPILSRADSLTFGKARAIKADRVQALLGGVIASQLRDAAPDAAMIASPWCREAMKPDLGHGIDRAGSGDGYTPAIADSGRSIDVYRGFFLHGDPSAGYPVALHGRRRPLDRHRRRADVSAQSPVRMRSTNCLTVGTNPFE